MPTVARGIEAGSGGGALGDGIHAGSGQACADARMAAAPHAPEQRAGGDAGRRKPVLERRDGAEVRQALRAHHGDPRPFALLVGLGLRDVDAQSRGRFLQVGDGEGHQFRAAQAGGEPEQEQRLVALAAQVRREGHGCQMLDGERRLLLAAAALAAADAGHRRAHLGRVAGRGVTAEAMGGIDRPQRLAYRGGLEALALAGAAALLHRMRIGQVEQEQFDRIGRGGERRQLLGPAPGLEQPPVLQQGALGLIGLGGQPVRAHDSGIDEADVGQVEGSLFLFRASRHQFHSTSLWRGVGCSVPAVITLTAVNSVIGPTRASKIRCDDPCWWRLFEQHTWMDRARTGPLRAGCRSRRLRRGRSGPI